MPIRTLQVPVPELTTPEMIEVDRVMVEDLGISLIQMMENAGRHLAYLARERFLGFARGRRVIVLAGTGGNGGGALVAARRLHGWGAEVVVATTREPASYKGVPAEQLSILRGLGVQVSYEGAPDLSVWTDLIIDGLIGYRLRGAPKGRAAELIELANESGVPVLSLDVPSGFDAARGIAHEPSIRAAATMTLALPKRGLQSSEHRTSVGELFLADIGVPPRAYEQLGIDVGSLFTDADIVRLLGRHRASEGPAADLPKRICIISTGGTIEKTYDELQGVLANQVSVLDVMLASLMHPALEIVRVPLMNKDSLEMSQADHELIAKTAGAMAAAHDGVVIVHGTDRLARTGERCHELLGTPPVPIVLTGAMRPYQLRNTDALQNLTEALLGAQLLPLGIWAVLHGKALRFPGVVKDHERGTFVMGPANGEE